MADQDEGWNDELAEEVSVENLDSLVVYSRDWTVDTILRQIEQDNIDLNPAFQRRNAWNDVKRSKLIESLIIGVPVPEIVLAEDLTKKKSFIVIDGKQRLLAIAGFMRPDTYGVWAQPKLKGLTTRQDLNGKTFVEITATDDDLRQLTNADIRCTIITGYRSNAVLYDIFYRLNTGSVPLSSQELRQALYRGPFSELLITSTNDQLPVHDVLNLREPDNRLRDAEILLRYISFSKFGPDYGGNLTPFLDESIRRINSDWAFEEAPVRALVEEFNLATSRLIEVFGERRVGRKFNENGWEVRFNRALFEVQAFYFGKLDDATFAAIPSDQVVTAFEGFCRASLEFRDSIETSTKNLKRYRTRYDHFQEFVNAVYGTQLDCVPLPVLA
jgi:hypothetical protein